MRVGVLILIMRVPGCASLKEKRGRLKPLIARLHKNHNFSVAEIDDHEVWGRAVLACALVSNDVQRIHSVLQKAAIWVEDNWRDLDLEDCQIELL